MSKGDWQKVREEIINSRIRSKGANFDSGEVALLGAGNFFLNEFVDFLIHQRINISCIVDDTKAGTKVSSIPVITSKEFLLSDSKMAINMTFRLNARNHFQKLAAAKSIPLIDYLDSVLLFNFSSKNFNYFNALLEDTLTHGEDFDKLLTFLGDQKSKDTLRAIYNFRTTFDPKVFDAIDSGLKSIYFPDDILSLGKNEAYVDCGAYDGDTIKLFQSKVNGSFEKIFAFEPDEKNFNSLSLEYGKDERIRLINKGVWKEDLNLYMSMYSGYSSRVNSIQNNSKLIQMVAIDSSVDHATFIKMDVENSELEALLGAEKTIRRSRPKLAISCYHSPNHIYEIPKLIKKIDPSYQIYLRHHDNYAFDTVMYAI